MPVALAPSSVAPSGYGTGSGFGTLAGSLTGAPQLAQAASAPAGAPTMYGGVPFNSLPAGNQAAILAAQQQGANSNTLAPGVATAAESKSDTPGFSMPPANDFVNAGLTAAGAVAPMGAGFLGSVVKGLFQQFTSGDEANTNNMSLAEQAAYGPGFGEQFVNWLASLFGESGGTMSASNADTSPISSMSSSIAAIGPGNISGSSGATGSLPSSTSGSFGDFVGSLGDFGDVGDVGAQQASKGGF